MVLMHIAPFNLCYVFNQIYAEAMKYYIIMHYAILPIKTKFDLIKNGNFTNSFWSFSAHLCWSKLEATVQSIFGPRPASPRPIWMLTSSIEYCQDWRRGGREVKGTRESFDLCPQSTLTQDRHQKNNTISETALKNKHKRRWYSRSVKWLWSIFVNLHLKSILSLGGQELEQCILPNFPKPILVKGKRGVSYRPASHLRATT